MGDRVATRAERAAAAADLTDLADVAAEYAANGYVVLRGVLSAGQAGELLQVCERVLGQWRERPLSDNPPVGPDANYLRHLNHPGYHEGRPAELAQVLDAAAAPLLLDAVEAIWGEPLTFISTSMYFNPSGETRDGFWHKDKIGVEADDPRDRETGSGLQAQIALVPSEDLELVPGSHLRDFTAAERQIIVDDDGANNRANTMPGAVRIKLQPGDAALFNQVCIHRGRYHATPPRRTFMVSLKKRRVAAATLQRRGLEQYSDQPWFLLPGYLDGTHARTRAFFDEHIAMYGTAWRAKLAELRKYLDLIRRLEAADAPDPFFASARGLADTHRDSVPRRS